MTPLEAEIHSRIAMEGPLSIADYMHLCLTHPSHGYYTSRPSIGGRGATDNTRGDFITAPEVSQLFGEMIGIWCMEMWQKLGEPSKFNLVELGPGRGTLMRDLLRISAALPAFKQAAELHLVEVSPALKKQQDRLLSQMTNVTWVGDISSLPDQPTLIIANEFLDTLPFRQWVRNGAEWNERSVGLVEGELGFVLRPNRLELQDLPSNRESEPDGAVFETSPAREGFIAKTAHQLKNCEGAALFIDYGHTQSGFGDTFQAIRDHEFTNPLAEPGRADLTNHVDFAPLVQTAKIEKCDAAEPTTQGEFLVSLGLLERAGQLGAGKTPEQQTSIKSAVERLAGPDQMGDLFKVMAFGAFGTEKASNTGWPGLK